MVLDLGVNEKILVVSPHPDDESIGCGGLLNKYRGHCDVLLVTDGYDEELDNRELSEKRKIEFINATDVSGVCERISLHIPEHQIKKNYTKFLNIDYSKYKYIFVPNEKEYHLDHIETYQSVKKAIKQKKAKSYLVEYEVWTTLKKPNILLDISDVSDLKIKAINEHKTQVALLDYVRFIMGLNAYRGAAYKYDYAEAFFCYEEYKAEKLRRKKRKIKETISKIWRK